jgi:hypothetical protein
MRTQTPVTAIINTREVLAALKKCGLSPTRGLFHMNNTSNVLSELMNRFPVPTRASQESTWDADRWKAWEAVGLYYITEGRHYEALSIFAACYDRLMRTQREGDFRLHKGKPLIWMSDCYWHMDWLVHAKRYLMLAFCEDLLTDVGVIIENRGAFYRGIWRHGMSEELFEALARDVSRSAHYSPTATRYPEALLQDMSEDWLTEAPDPREVGAFTANRMYIQHLISSLGDKSGLALERVAHYLLSCMPGVRTRRRLVSGSTEYDIVCSVDGLEQDFRSELGRYFICECKDWSSPADFTSLAKFARVLHATNAKFGILFSSKGVTGERKDRHAAREQLRLYQQEGDVIVAVTLEDLQRVAEGQNLIELLRKKYEAVRLDLLSQM